MVFLFAFFKKQFVKEAGSVYRLAPIEQAISRNNDG